MTPSVIFSFSNDTNFDLNTYYNHYKDFPNSFYLDKVLSFEFIEVGTVFNEDRKPSTVTNLIEVSNFK